MLESTIHLSVILPVHNEAESLKPLHDDLVIALDGMNLRYEVIYCDDGSTDGSAELIKMFCKANPAVKAVFLRKNFGQTAAISAGINHAQGTVIVLMDADGQNDPADIPNLLEKMNEGFDIVSGWRKNRKDPFITKILPSQIANFVIGKLTGLHLRDSGCTLKAYKREILEEIALYGEMHRFIPVFGYWAGAKVGEVEVKHHPRTKGKSKYSVLKTFKVLLDLPVLILLGRYLTRPVHFFGTIGLLFSLLSFITGLLLVYKKMIDPLEKIHRNPLLIICIFFALVAIQMVMMGLIAELLTRVYHESQNKKTYVIKEKENL